MEDFILFVQDFSTLFIFTMLITLGRYKMILCLAATHAIFNTTRQVFFD